MIKETAIRWLNRMMGDPAKAGPVRRWMASLFLQYFPGQITCLDFEQFIIDYVEEDLSDRARRRFEFHMAICPMCRSHFERYAKAVRLGKLAFDDPSASLPTEIPTDLVNAILAARLSDR